MHLYGPLLLVGMLAPGQAPGAEHYPQEYRRSFGAGADAPQDLMLVGPDATTFVRYEPAGVRLALPAGFVGDRPLIGVSAPLVVQGDFEITLAYEVVQEPSAAEAGKQTKLSLGITADAASGPQYAAVSRMVTEKHGTILAAWSLLWDDAKQRNFDRYNQVATKTKSGQLRLLRSASELSYWRSDGAGTPFVRLRADRFGSADVREVRAVIGTGGRAAALDVRLSDLHIRAASLQMAKAAVIPTAEETAPSPSDRSGRWWVLALFLLVPLALGTGFFLYMRRHSRAHACGR
jgi:hypothetical protein